MRPTSAIYFLASSFVVKVEASGAALTSETTMIPAAATLDFGRETEGVAEQRRLDWSDDECEWDYSAAECARPDICHYDYKFGDLTLSQSCRCIDDCSTPLPTVEPTRTPGNPTLAPTSIHDTVDCSDSDACCDWDYAAAQCEPTAVCEYRYVFGDVSLSQSCRLQEDLPDLPDEDDEEALDIGCVDSNDCCSWDYDQVQCVPEASCEYRYDFGDITLDQSCRLRTDIARCNDPLSCWLYNLNLEIAGEEPISLELDATVGTVHFYISEFTCKEFFLETVHSEYAGDAAVAFEIDGIGATCEGRWAYEYGIASGEGDLTATLGGSDLGLLVDLEKDELDYMAVGAVVQSCSTSINIASLDFGGSLLGWIADMFSAGIAEVIEAGVNSEVCDLVEAQAGDALTDAIVDLNTNVLTPLLDGAHADSELELPSDAADRFIDWGSNSGLNLLDWLLNDVIATHVNAGGCVDINTLVDIVMPHGRLSLDEDGLLGGLNISLPVGDDYAIISAGVRGLNVSGLDTFNALDLLEPAAGNFSLRSAVGMDELSITLSAWIEVVPLEGMEGSETLFQEFDIVVESKDIRLGADLLLAIEEQALLELHVGQLTDPNTALDCLLSAVYGLEFTDLSLDMLLETIAFVPRRLSGDTHLIEDIDTFINNFAQIMLHDFDDVVSDLINAMLQGPARRLINNATAALIDGSEHRCPDFGATTNATTAAPTPNLLNFDESAMVALASDFLNSRIGAEGMNAVLACVAKSFEAELGDDLVALEAMGLAVTVGNVRVGGLDAFYGIDVMATNATTPSVGLGHHSMDHALGIGECANASHLSKADALLLPGTDNVVMRSTTDGSFDDDGGCHPLTLTVSITLDAAASGIHDEIDLTVSMADLDTAMRTLIELDLDTLNRLRVGQLGNPSCLASTVAALEVDPSHTAVNLANMGIDVRATLTDGELVRRTFTGDAFTDTANLAMAELIEGLTPWANELVNKGPLYYAPYQCAGVAAPAPEEVQAPKFNWIGMGGGLMAVGLVVFAYKRYQLKRDDEAELMGRAAVAEVAPTTRVTFAETEEEKTKRARAPSAAETRRKRSRGLSAAEGGRAAARSKSDAAAPEPAAPKLTFVLGPLAPVVNRVHAWRAAAAESSESIMTDSKVPRAVRILVPVCLVLNFGLFLSANLVLGAAVDVDISLGSDVVTIPGLFLFTLDGTVAEMWEAKAYPLAILIAGFSGVFPYLKVSCMLAAWVLPLGLLDETRREKLLQMVDALGKWSLIDVYVMVMMMVGFRMHIALDAIMVDVRVNPAFGFYGFLMATMISLCMGHLVLYYHRAVTEDRVIPVGGKKESLAQHVHAFGKDGESSLRFTKLGKGVVFGALVGTLVLMIAGAIAPTFSFEFQGLAGWAVEITEGESAKSTYSLISLGSVIPDAVENPKGIAIRWLQFTYVIFALAVPLAYLVVLMVLYSVPLSLQNQRVLFMVAEVANAWSAVEVFVLSVVAAVMQIGSFAHFMVGDKCDVINELVGNVGAVKDALHGHAECFNVVATLDSGCYVLLASVVGFMCLSNVMLEAAHHSIEERIEDAQATEDRRRKRRGSNVKGVNPMVVNVGEVAGGGDEDEAAKTDQSFTHRLGVACLRGLDRVGVVEIKSNRERRAKSLLASDGTPQCEVAEVVEE